MGLSYAELGIANARRTALAPIRVQALADAGTLNSCTPGHVAVQLNLAELEKREVTLADGSRRALRSPCIEGRYRPFVHPNLPASVAKGLTTGHMP